MCKCTPEIRTPFCGKPGCEWPMQKENVNHPDHYGGKDNVYEAIKVIEAWQLGFNLGNSVKYISRAGKKHNGIEDLRKAQWYLAREIENLQKKEKQE